MYDCILVCLDGSPESETILPEVEKLLQAHPAKVILLQVGSAVDITVATREMGQDSNNPDLVQEEYDLLSTSSEIEIRRYLDGIGARMAKLGGTPIVEVSFNKPVDEILFFARHYQTDLIAMATHGRKGFSRLLHGSVTENVMEQAPCAMLIVRTEMNVAPRTG